MRHSTSQMLLNTAVVSAALLAAPASWASDKSEVQWSGKIYAHYGYMLGDEDEQYNEFDIKRVYLTAKTKLARDLSVRVTTDVGRAKPQDIDTDGDGEDDVEVPEDEKLRVFLKYAYLEWAAADAVTMRFGAAGTPFVGYYDKFWGQRYLAKSFTDDNKILDSSDMGVHALGKVSDGLITWQAAFVNGNGYGKAETSATKAVQGRVTLDPLAGGDHRLPLTVFASQDVMGSDDEEPVSVLAGAAGYKMNALTLWGEYVIQTEGDASGAGYSVTAIPAIPGVVNIIARYDHWDPDTDVDDDAETTLRTGVARDLIKKVTTSLTYERTTAEAAPDQPEHGVYVRMQAGF